MSHIVAVRTMDEKTDSFHSSSVVGFGQGCEKHRNQAFVNGGFAGRRVSAH